MGPNQTVTPPDTQTRWSHPKPSWWGQLRLSEPTQADAYADAKRFASNAGGGEVTLHGRDGNIRDKNTIAPAKDPRSTKG
ncbi:DUF2188 domain-containing protein [Knoellia remsis]|uniref:DUF2188 domain-containing protein n=1 Tax=Knoellia remsis TaxID=407159 RepID=UPI001C45F7EF